jgi:hypothetical protein
VLEAAAAFLAIEGDERMGVLSLEQFEASLVGQALVSANDEGSSMQKAQRMFDKADLNADGVIDFNEFLAMRRRAQSHLKRADGRKRRHAEKHAAAAHTDAEAVAQVGSWVTVARGVQEQEQERRREENDAEAARMAARYAMDDGLRELTADDLEVLESDLRARRGSAFDGDEWRSILNLFALRVGKLFAAADVDALLERVAQKQAGQQAIPVQVLLAALRAAQVGMQVDNHGKRASVLH